MMIEYKLIDFDGVESIVDEKVLRAEAQHLYNNSEVVEELLQEWDFNNMQLGDVAAYVARAYKEVVDLECHHCGWNCDCAYYDNGGE